MPSNDMIAAGQDEIALDEQDRRLLSLLQADGRASYAELASATGLSAGAARARVIRLRETGLLQVVAVTDPLKLGYRSMAMLAISVVGQADPEQVADALGSVEGVIYVVLAAGSIDLLVEVLAPDAETLYSIINRQIRAIPGVGRLETFTYYRTHTHRFSWPTL